MAAAGSPVSIEHESARAIGIWECGVARWSGKWGFWGNHRREHHLGRPAHRGTTRGRRRDSECATPRSGELGAWCREEAAAAGAGRKETGWEARRMDGWW